MLRILNITVFLLCIIEIIKLSGYNRQVILLGFIMISCLIGIIFIGLSNEVKLKAVIQKLIVSKVDFSKIGGGMVVDLKPKKDDKEGTNTDDGGERG